MSIKKFIAKMVGGFVLVFAVMFGIGWGISLVFNIDPFVVGRYTGMAIFVVGLIWGSTLVTALIQLLFKARTKEAKHESQTQ